MKDREPRLTSTDVLDYITPGTIRENWPKSIFEFKDLLKNKMQEAKRPIVLYVGGPPLAGKTTTLHRILSEFDPEIVDQPLEWGDITKNKGLDTAPKLRSSTKLQRWKLTNSLDQNGHSKKIHSFESPLITSFPRKGRPMERTYDRGLTTLISAARRDDPFFSDVEFDLFVLGLISEFEMESALKITRSIIADKVMDENKSDTQKIKEIRKILEEKGADTTELSANEILHYAYECANISAIEGIDKQIDELVLRLYHEKVLHFDPVLYVNNPHYRVKVLGERLVPALFDTLGSPRNGRSGENIYFVGKVSRAERIKMHSLKKGKEATTAHSSFTV